MNDLIDRQAAIDEIDEWIKAFLENGHKESAADACLIQDGIIQLPSVQQEEPSHEAVREYCRKRCLRIVDAVFLEKYAPSAQPEIIRCKDCRWWDKYGDYDTGYCMAARHGYWTEHWDISIRRKYRGDFYCADAEPYDPFDDEVEEEDEGEQE